MTRLERVAVFCGSSDTVDPGYIELAAELGQALAHAGLGLVYGGGASGLMGAVAQAGMEAGGEVTGVLPAGLFNNGADHGAITTLEFVTDMHARKARMYELADGFIGLPGGMGTFEEVFEAATWTQLGLHTGNRRKRVVLLDRNGYWKPVHELLDRAAGDGFLAPDTRQIVRAASSIDGALTLLHGA